MVTTLARLEELPSRAGVRAFAALGGSARELPAQAAIRVTHGEHAGAIVEERARRPDGHPSDTCAMIAHRPRARPRIYDHAVRISAGILLFRRGPDGLEVLLGHPGGPIFARRDAGHWTILKGEPDPDEPLIEAARREFREETGLPPPAGEWLELGSIVQRGGKVVYAWAVEGDLRPEDVVSETFELEWPPRSGLRETHPEIDRVAWFDPVEARRRIKEAQTPFIGRLEASLRG